VGKLTRSCVLSSFLCALLSFLLWHVFGDYCTPDVDSWCGESCVLDHTHTHAHTHVRTWDGAIKIDVGGEWGWGVNRGWGVFAGRAAGGDYTCVPACMH
jgi:hypothetical protein